MDSENITLLVLESPFDEVNTNPLQASVQPFLNGLERATENFRLQYSHFYDKTSLKLALQRFTNNKLLKHPRIILYISSHGESDSIQGIPLDDFISIIHDNNKLIEGIYLATCSTGHNIDKLLKLFISTQIAWVFAYKCPIKWQHSMLVDLSVLNELTYLDRAEIRTKNTVMEKVKSALSIFNPDSDIAYDSAETPLSQAVTLLVKSKHQQKGRDKSTELFE